MDLQGYSFEFTYSKEEFKKAFRHTKTFSKILLSFILLIVSLIEILLPTMLSNSDTLKIAFSAIFGLIGLISLIFLFFTLLKIPKQNAYLQAIQKLHFENNELVFENGSHIFKIETKYILRIEELKYFYHIRLAITGADEAVRHILISPIIPRRIALRNEMQQLADSLRVELKIIKK